jgi:nitroreductase
MTAPTAVPFALPPSRRAAVTRRIGILAAATITYDLREAIVAIAVGPRACEGSVPIPVCGRRRERSRHREAQAADREVTMPEVEDLRSVADTWGGLASVSTPVPAENV